MDLERHGLVASRPDIPRAIGERAIALALEKVAKESRSREDLVKGKPLAEVHAAYGVL